MINFYILLADAEILEKQHPSYRAGNFVHRYVSEFKPPADFESVPLCPDDFPFNVGCLYQKFGARDGAYYFCLAGDYCRRKKVVIEVKNREFELHKEKKKHKLLMKGRVVEPAIQDPQTIHDLDVESSVIKHLKNEHWSLLIQTGYADSMMYR